MALDTQLVREQLQSLDFQRLFIDGLGWSLPDGSARLPVTVELAGVAFERRQIARLGGVVVLELRALEGGIPHADVRATIHREISQQHFENLLIFLDAERTQSLWHWVKRDGTKRIPRDHLYVKGQPGDLFLSKIAPMFVDIGDLNETGDIAVIDVANRLREALDVQPVTKKFFEEFRDEHLRFTELIDGIDDDRDRRWYASVLLNRLMFVYFLQRKGFLDGGRMDYLRDKLLASTERGTDQFYSEFLKALFFEGFAKPPGERSAEAAALVGEITYLNGGLFLPHPIEGRWPGIDIPDRAFENLFGLFGRYSWNLDDTPGGNDNEINPDVLGYIFEKYINQKAFGAYYTPPEITEYLCEGTIHRLILERVNLPAIPGLAPARRFDSVPDLLMSLDARLCRELLFEILPTLSLLDPACGSGAFLVAAMKTLIKVYSAVTGQIPYLGDTTLDAWWRDTLRDHPSLNYYIKKKIITENLYGVDIMEEATEIARLRLFLALVSSVNRVVDLEPLPNIDFNILAGNSLIGLLRVDEDAYNRRSGGQLGLFHKPYRTLVEEKNRLIETYRETGEWHDDLRALRDTIEAHRAEARTHLNEMLLDEFRRLGVKYEQATWDEAKGREGKAKKRDVRIADIEALGPFHWGYEFDQVMNERGGFDAIITNPPWEIVKPQAKEFFADYSELISKNAMRIEDFEKQKATLLAAPEVRDAWLEYQSRFPYMSAWFRATSQYENQISVVNGKKAGTDINLYKLFTEQSYNLLRPGGECGIVIPSGIYTDLGAKQLREMLFGKTRVTGLFGFENRKAIFEGVHRSFKFIVLTFEKGGATTAFPSAFMRLDVAELEQFPQQGALPMPVELIRRLSPDSLSIMEFKAPIDIQIAEKMLRFPLLGEQLSDTWNLRLSREFDMTNDSHLFRTEPGPGHLPLYEGKMIHQFTHQWAKPRYWVDEREARAELTARSGDTGQTLGYQDYRLGFRDIARNTDERTMIAAILPGDAFAGNTINLSDSIGGCTLLAVTSVLNGFASDSIIRQKVNAHCNMFYVYQLPIPRLTERDPQFRPIVERAAKLICTTPEFDDLAREVGLSGHEEGVTDPTERARLRAELDGIIALLYGLTREEFAHVLSTFPLVKQEVKDAALQAYVDLTPLPGDPEVVALIAADESPMLERKQDVFWDDTGGKRGEKACWKTVAAFLNTDGGDLLIGVHDDGSIVGLESDYARLSKRPDRDGWQQAVAQLLVNALGVPPLAHVRVTIHEIAGRDICRIRVHPAPGPAWVQEGATETLYVRVGNTTRPITGSAATEYVRRHWS